MARIAVLNEVLINQIAAGEVVERPASVIKELCENSLDAQAQVLRVSLEGGGVDRIVVSDDGHGMSAEDARLCLTRHATSKLNSLEGLLEIGTKGFRGEALPAIAAVSRLSLHTSEPQSVVGTRVSIEGGGLLLSEEAPARSGTLISVEDLFFNTPARRKFMRRQETEVKHALEAVIRLALAHPECAFFLSHEGRALFSSPASPTELRERIAAALGSEIYPHLLPVEEQRLGLSVRGWISSPEYTLSSARGLYTFVNRRYIRDRGLNAAVQRAFQEWMPTGRQPVVVLFVDVDPRSVDVNVHPQKTEVRFSDARGVCDAVHAALLRTLKPTPWLSPAQSLEEGPRQAAHYAQAVERFLTLAQETAWGEPLAGATHQLGEAHAGFGQLRPQINEAPPPAFFSRLKPLSPLADRFQLCEGPGGTLVIVDPHAAIERLRLRDFQASFAAGQPPPLSLFGTSLTLAPSLCASLLKSRSALLRLGFELEDFGGNSLALRALPAALSDADLPALLEALAPLLPADSPDSGWEAFAPAAQLMACYAARRDLSSMGAFEFRSLLASLDDVAFHVPCIHSRVVLLEMPLLELERRAEG